MGEHLSMQSQDKISPREVVSRDDYYMGLAFWIASKSKDPNTQVGSVIVGADNSPVSTGYNGPPAAVPDELVNWSRPFKYDLVRHSESNAIRYAKTSLVGATLYVTAPPCKKCMLEIVSERISRVIYFRVKITDLNSSLNNRDDWNTTIEIAKLGGTEIVEFHGDLNWMRERIFALEDIGIFG